MFVTHVKGLKLDQRNLTVLYGYGGFGLSLPPSFSVARLVFMKFMRGVFVQANLRGGAEYGTYARRPQKMS
jgi:prolyl oligopeptidase